MCFEKAGTLSEQGEYECRRKFRNAHDLHAAAGAKEVPGAKFKAPCENAFETEIDERVKIVRTTQVAEPEHIFAYDFASFFYGNDYKCFSFGILRF